MGFSPPEHRLRELEAPWNVRGNLPEFRDFLHLNVLNCLAELSISIEFKTVDDEEGIRKVKYWGCGKISINMESSRLPEIFLWKYKTEKKSISSTFQIQAYIEDEVGAQKHVIERFLNFIPALDLMRALDFDCLAYEVPSIYKCQFLDGPNSICSAVIDPTPNAFRSGCSCS